jgi:hypothetical protein
MKPLGRHGMVREMTVQEVVLNSGVTFAYVYALLRSGRFEGATKGDGEWSIPAKSLDAFLERRKRRR